MPQDEHRVAETIGEGSCAVVKKVIHQDGTVSERHYGLRVEGDNSTFNCCGAKGFQIYCRKFVVRSPDDVAMWKENVEALNNEAMILRTLKHENIVKMFTHQPGISLDLEYCENGDLDNLINDRRTVGRPMEENEVWNIFYQILEGLYFCHYQQASETANGRLPNTDTPMSGGILHGDLKPRNILITAKNKIKICDFGRSQRLNTEDIQEKKWVGTPSFMAPEIWAPAGKKTLSCDIWSLGCTMYEVCTFERLYKEGEKDKDGNWAELIAKIQTMGLPKLPKYSDCLQKEMRRCLEKDPKWRPTTGQLLIVASFKHRHWQWEDQCQRYRLVRQALRRYTAEVSQMKVRLLSYAAGEGPRQQLDFAYRVANLRASHSEGSEQLGENLETMLDTHEQVASNVSKENENVRRLQSLQRRLGDISDTEIVLTRYRKRLLEALKRDYQLHDHEYSVREKELASVSADHKNAVNSLSLLHVRVQEAKQELKQLKQESEELCNLRTRQREVSMKGEKAHIELQVKYNELCEKLKIADTLYTVKCADYDKAVGELQLLKSCREKTHTQDHFTQTTEHECVSTTCKNMDQHIQHRDHLVFPQSELPSISKTSMKFNSDATDAEPTIVLNSETSRNKIIAVERNLRQIWCMTRGSDYRLTVEAVSVSSTINLSKVSVRFNPRSDLQWMKARNGKLVENDIAVVNFQTWEVWKKTYTTLEIKVKGDYLRQSLAFHRQRYCEHNEPYCPHRPQSTSRAFHNRVRCSAHAYVGAMKDKKQARIKIATLKTYGL